MAQEEQSEKSSYSATSGGGNGGSGSLVNNGKSVSRKPKPKRVPQRGLGVAQLEKIRLEEQQKRDAALSVFPSSSQTKSFYPTLPINPSFNHSQSRNSPLIPIFAEIPRQDSIFRPPGSVQGLDANADAVPLANSVGWLESPSQAQGSVSSESSAKLWSPRESKVDPRSSSSGFCSNMLWPYESNLTLPLPGLNLQYQQAPSSASPSSVATFASASCSLPSTSVMTFQIEPPSNQIYCNSFSSFWLEEDKRGDCFKRPFPFSLGESTDPGPSLPYEVPSLLHHSIGGRHHSIGGPDKTVSLSTSRCGVDIEAGKPIFREVPSWSTPASETNPKNENKGSDALLIGDFLTLAPPASTPTTTSCKSPKFKHPNPLYRNHERVDFESLPYQIGAEDRVLIPGASGQSRQPVPPCYSFFPSAGEQNGQATPSSSYGSCVGSEGSESLDLELRL